MENETRQTESDPPHDSTSPPTGGGEASGSPKRLTRSTRDEMFFGVAGGVSDYLGIDPIFIRIAFIALSIFGGTGIAIYFVLAMLLPKDDGSQSFLVERNWSKAQTGVALAVLIVGVLLVAGNFGDPGVLLPVALIGLGLYLLYDRQPEIFAGFTNKPATSGQPGAPTATIPTVQANVTTASYGPAAAKTPTFTPRPRRRRSPVGLAAFGSAFMVGGIAAALGRGDVIDLEAQQVLALSLFVLGLGIFVGAWFGKAKWLMIFVIPLTLITAAASTASVGIDAGAGVDKWQPVNATELQAKYELGAGKTILDLSSLAAIPGNTNVDVEQGAGDLVVAVPPGLRTTVDASASVGLVQVFRAGQPTLEDDGPSAGVVHTYEPTATVPAPNDAALTLDVHNGFGRVFITDNANAKELVR